MVPRTEGYTYDAKVWDLSIVQEPFFVAPCQTFANVTIRKICMDAAPFPGVVVSCSNPTLLICAFPGPERALQTLVSIGKRCFLIHIHMWLRGHPTSWQCTDGSAPPSGANGGGALAHNGRHDRAAAAAAVPQEQACAAGGGAAAGASQQAGLRVLPSQAPSVVL
jgi:hypothetical protein